MPYRREAERWVFPASIISINRLHFSMRFIPEYIHKKAAMKQPNRVNH